MDRLFFILILILVLNANAEHLDSPSLGRAISPEAARAGDTIVLPDGTGLPAGQGRVTAGQALYDSRCVTCHGAAGRGGTGGELAGGEPDLTRDSPDQTVGTYWPHATTLFGFIRRTMAMDAPWSLTDDQVNAVSAYILHLNGLNRRDRGTRRCNAA